MHIKELKHHLIDWAISRSPEPSLPAGERQAWYLRVECWGDQPRLVCHHLQKGRSPVLEGTVEDVPIALLLESLEETCGDMAANGAFPLTKPLVTWLQEKLLDK